MESPVLSSSAPTTGLRLQYNNNIYWTQEEYTVFRAETIYNEKMHIVMLQIRDTLHWFGNDNS